MALVTRIPSLLALGFCGIHLFACQESGPECGRSICFPQSFLWGVAASAYQTEGNNHNDWEREIEEKQRYPAVGRATNYYQQFDSDHALVKDLGVNLFRFGVEWSRIEPEKGIYSPSELEHYREVIVSLRNHGLQPMLTMHHFTNPIWLADEGGWTSEDLKERFSAYARKLAEEYGGMVDYWVTINEPMVYLSGLKLLGVYPGSSVLDMEGFQLAAAQMIFAHAQAVEAIREADQIDADGDGKPCQIVGVMAVTPTWPEDPKDPNDAVGAEHYDYAYNRMLLNAWIRGNLDLDFDQKYDNLQTPVPEGFYEELAGSIDILGVNYYNRAFVMGVADADPPLDAIPCLGIVECGNKTDLTGDNGNEIYPSGIYTAIENLSGYGLPMMITENGVADKQGKLRAQVVVMHLMQVARAISAGYDLRGYLHWSLTDNYEWAQGYDMRFGLYRVDFETQQRTLTEGGEVLREIVQSSGISAELVQNYNVERINPLASE